MPNPKDLVCPTCHGKEFKWEYYSDKKKLIRLKLCCRCLHVMEQDDNFINLNLKSPWNSLKETMDKNLDRIQFNIDKSVEEIYKGQVIGELFNKLSSEITSYITNTKDHPPFQINKTETGSNSNVELSFEESKIQSKALIKKIISNKKNHKEKPQLFSKKEIENNLLNFIQEKVDNNKLNKQNYLDFKEILYSLLAKRNSSYRINHLYEFGYAIFYKFNILKIQSDSLHQDVLKEIFNLDRKKCKHQITQINDLIEKYNDISLLIMNSNQIELING